MTQQDAEDSSYVITVTILIYNIHALVLINLDRMHSFISIMFLAKLNRMIEPLSEELVIYTFVGDTFMIS